MITRRAGQDNVPYVYNKGRWIDDMGKIGNFDPPPPLPTFVFTPKGESVGVQHLGIGTNSFTLVLNDDEIIVGSEVDVILWICRTPPQRIQLEELHSRYPKGYVFQMVGRFTERDLAILIEVYSPKVIMPVMGDTELSFIRKMFAGDIIRAEMSSLSGSMTHVRFLNYREIVVEAW